MNSPPRPIRRVRRKQDWEAWVLLGLASIVALPLALLVLRNFALMSWGSPTEAVVESKVIHYSGRSGNSYSLNYRYNTGNRQFHDSDYTSYEDFEQTREGGTVTIRQVTLGNLSYSTTGSGDKRAWDLVMAYGIILLIGSPLWMISMAAGPCRLLRDRSVARSGISVTGTLVSWRIIGRDRDLHWIRYSFETRDGRRIKRWLPYLVVDSAYVIRMSDPGDPIEIMYLPGFPRWNMPMEMSAYLPVNLGCDS